MSNKLVYLGFTGTKHRVATVDLENMGVIKVAVEDYALLPNMFYTNCKAEKGVPKIQAGAVLATLGEASSQVTAVSDAWDGCCVDTNWYVLGYYAYTNTDAKNRLTRYYVCISATGDVALFTLCKLCSLIRAGCVFIQFEQRLNQIKKTSEYIKQVAVRTAYASDLESEQLVSEVKAVWSCYSANETGLLDMRKYASAEVVGLELRFGNRGIILPENLKAVWLGFIANNKNLRYIYLPASVTTLHSYLVPKQRVKQIVFYSDSLAVVAFASSCGASCIPCSAPEAMLKDFYKSSSDEYVSVADASSLAILAGVASYKQDDYGRLKSAILFSATDTGFNYSILQERFPIVKTISLSIAELVTTQEALMTVQADTLTKQERIRLMVACFTQFYPLHTPKDTELACVFVPLYFGAYTLYMQYKAVPYADRLVLLKCTDTNTFIHCFKLSEIDIYLFFTIYNQCLFDCEPSGVFRYFDKMASVSYPALNSGDIATISDSVFSTFHLFSYAPKNSLRRLVGIDLHTGDFISSNRRQSTVDNLEKFLGVQKWFYGVSRLSDVVSVTGAGIKLLLYRDCEYYKNNFT